MARQQTENLRCGRPRVPTARQAPGNLSRNIPVMNGTCFLRSSYGPCRPAPQWCAMDSPGNLIGAFGTLAVGTPFSGEFSYEQSQLPELTPGLTRADFHAAFLILHFADGASAGVTLTALTAVPEPSRALLSAAGLMFLPRRRRMGSR